MAAILHFSYGALYGRNFCPISFKFGYKLQSCFSQFAIENQQNRLISFDVITERKIQNFRQEENFRTWTRKVSFYANPDPQITNLILFCRFNDNLGRYRGYRGRSSLSFLHFRSKYMHVKRHQKLADDMFCLDNLITNNDSKYKQSIFVYVYKIIVKALVIYL